MDRIYIGSNGRAAAINTQTGEIIWEVKFKNSSKEVSIVEKENFLFVGCQGKFYCLNKQDGQTIWVNELKGWGYENIGIAMEGISVQYQTKIIDRS